MVMVYRDEAYQVGYAGKGGIDERSSDSQHR